MVTELLSALVLIYMVLAFHRRFKQVDPYLAVQVILFGGVMPALLNFVDVVSDAGALRGDGADATAAHQGCEAAAAASAVHAWGASHYLRRGGLIRISFFAAALASFLALRILRSISSGAYTVPRQFAAPQWQRAAESSPS